MAFFFGRGKGEGSKLGQEKSWEEKKEEQINRSAMQFAKDWRANGRTPEQFYKEWKYKNRRGVSGIEITQEYSHMKMLLWQDFFSKKEAEQAEKLQEFTEALQEVLQRAYDCMTKN